MRKKAEGYYDLAYSSAVQTILKKGNGREKNGAIFFSKKQPTILIANTIFFAKLN